jgi:phosphoglycolate phosphatase
MKHSIIFDIDGTLLYTRGVGRTAFGIAFEVAYGVPYPDVSKICFIGATDSNLIRNMAKECNVENTTAKEEHFYLQLAREIDHDLSINAPHVYQGVPQLLKELNNAGIPLGIITGNIRPTAWSKLRHGKIDSSFRFGAYGDDHHDRDAITKIAVSRAPATAPVAMMIGDTPLDIKAAKANNLIALAVATGWISAEELSDAGADLVITDFSDTQSSIAQIHAMLNSRR